MADDVVVCATDIIVVRNSREHRSLRYLFFLPRVHLPPTPFSTVCSAIGDFSRKNELCGVYNNACVCVYASIPHRTASKMCVHYCARGNQTESFDNRLTFPRAMSAPTALSPLGIFESEIALCIVSDHNEICGCTGAHLTVKGRGDKKREWNEGKPRRIRWYRLCIHIYS